MRQERRIGGIVLAALALAGVLADAGLAAGSAVGRGTMRVTLKTEGGIAHFPGLARPVTIDLADLPAEKADELRALVGRADVFARPDAADAAPSRGADLRTHTLTIEEDGRSRTLRLAEPIAEPALRELVQAAEALARARLRAKPGS